MSTNLTKFAYQAARDLGCLRAGQTLSADILADIQDHANQMLDSWLIEEFVVPASPAEVFTLTPGTYIYQIGPGQAPPNFNAARPTGIDDANIILNTVSPVLRTPLEVINTDQWASIPIQNLANTLPTRIYYEKGFDITSGFARLLLWGGPVANYQLELFAWDQTVLRAFTDLTTGYIYPPGYALLIRKSLAVAIAPLMTMYSKAARVNAVLAPSQTMLTLVMKQADDARIKIEQYNSSDEILTGDPAFMGQSARKSWNYLTGTDGRAGR